MVEVLRYIMAYAFIGAVVTFILDWYIRGFDSAYKTEGGKIVVALLWPLVVAAIVLTWLSQQLEKGCILIGYAIKRMQDGPPQK